VKDPSTGKWVEDTKAFRQQRLLLRTNNKSRAYSSPPKASSSLTSTRLSPTASSPSPKKHSAEANVSWGDLSAVRNSSSPPGAAGAASFSQWETPQTRGAVATEGPRSSPQSSPRSLNNASISSSSSSSSTAKANVKAQFEGLNEQETADLKAAWNKILG